MNYSIQKQHTSNAGHSRWTLAHPMTEEFAHPWVEMKIRISMVKSLRKPVRETATHSLLSPPMQTEQ